jgi:hypothetical protein
MSEVTTDLQTALTALQSAVTADAAQAPSLGDNLLEALKPLLLATGWTAPAVVIPVTTTAVETETPAEDLTDTPLEA